MKIIRNWILLGTLWSGQHHLEAFILDSQQQQKQQSRRITGQVATTRAIIASPLFVSIGLGPDSPKQQVDQQEPELVAGVDYEIPNHESFRTSRRSKLDERCDAWFAKLLGDDDTQQGCLGDLAVQARKRCTTPVELKNEVQIIARFTSLYLLARRVLIICFTTRVVAYTQIRLPKDDMEWTPYVSTKLPWTPLTPAFGLEEFGLPVPRRNAETWRHFDVVGMVEQDYSKSPEGTGTYPTNKNSAASIWQE
jgi:hypothetical protein